MSSLMLVQSNVNASVALESFTVPLDTPLVISAVPATRYSLVDKTGSVSLEHLKIEREDMDLEVLLDDECILIIEGFYEAGMQASFVDINLPVGHPALAVSDGLMNASAAETDWYSNHQEDPESSFHATSFVAGIFGGGALLASIADANESNSQETRVLSIEVVAGNARIVANVELFDQDGNLIVSGITSESGVVDFDIPSNINGSLLAIASSDGSDLVTDLRAVIEVNRDNSLVCITPLTELAFRHAEEVATPSADSMTITDDFIVANQQVGQLFGVTDITGVVEFQPGSEETNDHLEAQYYGQVLSILSNLDKQTGGLEQTLFTLNANLVELDGELVWGRNVSPMLQQGVDDYLVTAGGLDLSDWATTFTPPIVEVVGTGLGIDESEDGVVLRIGNVSAGDRILIHWGDVSYSETLSAEDITHNVAHLLVPANVIQQAGDGDLTIHYQFNQQMPRMKVFLPVDLTAPSQPLVALDVDSGIEGDQLTNQTRMRVVTEEEASWVFSTDKGGTWQPGIGNSFDLAPNQIYDPGDIQVRQSDAVGNVSDVFVNQQSVSIDQISPVAIISIADKLLTQSESTVVTIQFSERVIGFALDDLLVSFSTLSNLQTLDNGVTWTATLTPEERQESGGLRISVGTDFSDLAGNAPATPVRSDTFVVDTSDIVFLSGSHPSVSIEENAGSGQVVFLAAAEQRTVASSTSSGISYRLSGADAALLDIDEQSGSVTLVRNPDHESRAVYQFNVIASDLAGNTETQSVSLEVIDQDESIPVFANSSILIELDENSSIDQSLHTAHALDTADVDDSTDSSAQLTYSLAGTDAASLAIDTTTGVITLREMADHERQAFYSFDVVATDSGNNLSTQAVSLIVSDRDEGAPVFTSGSEAPVIEENSGAGQVIYVASATDTNDIDNTVTNSNSVTFGLSGLGEDNFQINAQTGAVTLIENPDYEVNTSYVFDVTATDPFGNASSRTVTLSVSDLDDTAPQFLSGSIASAVSENEGAVLVYSIRTDDLHANYTLAGMDSDSFTLVDGGVTFLGGADYESQSSYEFTVTATDETGNRSIQTVTMAVNDVDEVAPSFASGPVAAPVDENSGAAVVYTATSNDPDAIYTLGGTDAAAFSISSGVVTFNGNANFEVKSSYLFDVIATDVAGNHSTITVAMAVNNLDEVAPLFTSGPVATSVDENSGSSVVYSATSDDPDAIYTLGGTDAAAFSISNGVVTFNGNADFEAKSSYLFDVIATDTTGNRSIKTVTMAVNDIDDLAPMFTSGSTAASVDENSSAAVVYTATSNDPDAIYTLSGTDAAAFSISNGVVTFSGNADFETKSSYLFDVIVTDMAGNRSTKTVTMSVNDRDESAPQFTIFPTRENAGFLVTWSSENQDESGHGIYAQRFDTDGNNIGGVFKVNSQRLNSREDSSALTLNDGGFLVTWSDYSQGIFGQRYDRQGDVVGDNFQISPAVFNGSYTSVDSAQLSNSSYAVVWAEDMTTGSGLDIRCQLFDANGNTHIEDFRVNYITTRSQYGPDIASLADGGFVVTWQSQSQDTSEYGIYGRRFDANGNAVGDEFRANTYTTANQSDAAVIGLRDGGFIVTWNSSGQDGSGYGVYGQLYGKNGQVLGNEFQINSYTLNSQNRSSVAALINGGFVVSWESTGQDGSGKGIYGQLFDAIGNAVGEEFRINTYVDSHQLDSSVSALDNGGFIVTWVSSGQAHSGYSVYGQLFGQDGNRSGSEFLVNTYTNEDQRESDVDGFLNIFSGVVSINESSGINQVVYKAHASDTRDIDDDSDNSAAVIYTLAGEDANLFSLNSVTGELILLENTGEPQSSYNIEIIAQDDAGNRAHQTLLFYVNDDLAPSFTSGTTVTSIDENSSAAVVYTATSNDPDAIYTLSGTDAAAFSISNGVVTFSGNADFEVKSFYEFEVIATDLAGNQSSQIVAMNVNDVDESNPVFTRGSTLGNGGFVVTWTSNGQDGSDYGIYGQRYDNDGKAVGSEFQINSYTSGDQIMSSVTTLLDGGFVVTWSSFNQDGDDYGVYGQRYDADGNVFGSEFQVNTFTSSDQLRPDVTSLLDGSFVVIWDSNGQDGSNYGVYGQRYDINGNTVGSEFQVDTYTSGSQSEPDVTALADGGFVVTWQSNGQDGSSNGIYGQRYDSDGNKTGDEFQINTSTSNDQLRPSVTGLLDGSFVVTWASYSDLSATIYGPTIYGQRYDVDGNSVGSEFQISTIGDASQISSVTSLMDGGFVVAWWEPGDLYGRLFDADVTAVGTEFQINSHTSSIQYQPSFFALDDGGFVVTWASRYQDGSGYGIYGQRFDEQGNTVGDEFQINTYTSGDQDEPDVAGFVNLFGGEISIDENSGANHVVYTANATDTLDDGTDNSSSLIYSLSGLDASKFNLNSVSGELTLLENPDYETQSSYSLEITATDNSGNSATQDIQVRVSDFDETAVIFDTVSGQSSDIDGRHFNADTSYNIFVLVDSDATTPQMNQMWSGGLNLGSDDRLVFIGDTGGIRNQSGGTGLSNVTQSGDMELFEVNGVQAFSFGDNGEFTRVTGAGSESVDLWNGDASLPPLGLDTAILDELPDWVTPLS